MSSNRTNNLSNTIAQNQIDNPSIDQPSNQLPENENNNASINEAESDIDIAAALSFTESKTSLLGAGGFAKVYKGTLFNKDCAVKVFNFKSDTEKSNPKQKSFDVEVLMLSALAQKEAQNIIKFYGAYSIPEQGGYIVTEFVEGGNLSNLIKTTQYSGTQILEWLTQISRGMVYLHQDLEMIHRDIKPDNILITRNQDKGIVLKITDFGSAKFINQDTFFKKSGTLEWSAPETLEECHYSIKSDVYSFGMIAWQLNSKDHIPYHSSLYFDLANKYLNYEISEEEYHFKKNAKIKDFVLKGGRLDLPERSPRFFANLIRTCWSHQPEKRPDSVTLNKLLEKTLSEHVSKLKV